MTETLAALVAEELRQPVDPRVTAIAAAIAARYPDAARSVLFYGSCLRETQLDGLMLDFYLIVSDYRKAYGRGWLALANRLLPPNVFPFEHEGLAAKYAVLSEEDFPRLASSETRSVSVWARFSQPSRLVWARDAAASEKVTRAVAGAGPALLAAARPMMPDDVTPLDLWRGAYALTYSAELRTERGNRAQSLVDIEPERYLRFTDPALEAIRSSIGQTPLSPPLKGKEDSTIASPSERRRAERMWQRRRIEGKLLSIARLIKATTTFAGGIDYLAWKINRHAGTRIVIQPWQRRWPILGAISLLPRLLKEQAIR